MGLLLVVERQQQVWVLYQQTAVYLSGVNE
jgi:hypothetical protein